MSTKNDGGPAFPANTLNVPFKDADAPQYQGMTLRDYFAAVALPAEIARWADGHPNGYEGIAAIAFLAADAMLKARVQP